MIGEYDWCLVSEVCKCWLCLNPNSSAARKARMDSGHEDLFAGVRWYCEIWSKDGVHLSDTKRFHSTSRAIKTGGKTILRMISSDMRLERWMSASTASDTQFTVSLSDTSQAGATVSY